MRIVGTVNITVLSLLLTVARGLLLTSGENPITEKIHWERKECTGGILSENGLLLGGGFFLPYEVA